MEVGRIAQAREDSPAQIARRATAVAVSALAPRTRAAAPKVSPATDAASSTSHSATPRSKRRALNDIIAGGVGGTLGFLVGHPLDTLKVRSQMMATTSAGEAVVASNAAPTFRHLMKGVGAPVAMAAALNASIFLTHGASTRTWDNCFGAPDGNNNHATNNKYTKSAVCGGVAGIASAFTMCPTEHIKTKLQTQSVTSSVVYKNSMDAARQIFVSHGTAGLFRGFNATLARQTPGFVVYFSIYERLKDRFGAERSMLASIAAGGIAGSCSWAVIYPIDFVKSRIQALPLDCGGAERSMGHVLREAVRHRGWRALYRGFGVTVLRAFPVNGIIFPTYEVTVRALNGMNFER
jgi:solute carrier family 25 carnitine/acylcarnitine transporter 20/29